MAVLATAGSALLAGCALVDQRTFDPAAGRPPVPYVAPAVPGKVVPPFLVVGQGTPPAQWQPVVTNAVKVALSRKPSVLFVVTGMAPDHESPDAQARALDALASHDARAVVDTIIKAGARPIQVQMQVRSDPQGAPRVQVDVR